MSDAYGQIKKVIESNNSFLLVSHAHPDGDGIGSTLALGLVLKRLGKKVVIYNQDGVPRPLDFLPGADELVSSVDGNAVFDATFMIDLAQPERGGRDFPPPERRGILVCIDHHITECSSAQIVCQDEKASSAGEVIYRLLQKIGAEVTPDVAVLILTTIIVDTGFFRYSNTSARALKLSADLMEKGAETWFVAKNMEERNPPEQLKLLSSALETVERFAGGKAAVMTLTRQMLSSSGADVSAAEDFINFPRSIDGVEVAVLIREKAEGEFKVSFRSKDFVNVARLAKKWDGGGHEHAAGCTLKGRYGDVKLSVMAEVEKAVNP